MTKITLLKVRRSYLTISLGLKFTAGFRHKAYRLLTWIWEVRA